MFRARLGPNGSRVSLIAKHTKCISGSHATDASNIALLVTGNHATQTIIAVTSTIFMFVVLRVYVSDDGVADGWTRPPSQTVEGLPVLELNAGPNAVAIYKYGGSDGVMSFLYTVSAVDETDDLDTYGENALVIPEGAAIQVGRPSLTRKSYRCGLLSRTG